MKFSITIKGRTYDVDVQKSSGDPGRYRVTVDGSAFEASVQDGDARIAPSPAAAPAPVKAPASPSAGAAIGGNRITAPMPGTIVAVLAGEGDAVKQGQEVITMETMKMNVPLFAPADGILRRIGVKKGDSVAVDQVLAEIEK